jgi:hypothetical protein
MSLTKKVSSTNDVAIKYERYDIAMEWNKDQFTAKAGIPAYLSGPIPCFSLPDHPPLIVQSVSYSCDL